MTRAALPHLQRGGSIINTSSINAYKVRLMMMAWVLIPSCCFRRATLTAPCAGATQGHPLMIDYSATKGAQCVRAPQHARTRMPPAQQRAFIHD